MIDPAIIDDLMDFTNHQYDRNLVARIYAYMGTKFRISADKSKSNIVKGALIRKDVRVPSRMAVSIYDYLLRQELLERYGRVDETNLKYLNAAYGNVELIVYNDVIQGASGPYGLCPTNPIPTRGIGMEYRYVERLRTSSGGKTKYSRFGSFSSPISKYPVDMFNLTDENGNKLHDVWVSGYQAITSSTPPEGYILADE